MLKISPIPKSKIQNPKLKIPALFSLVWLLIPFVVAPTSDGVSSPLPNSPEWNTGFSGERALAHVRYLASDLCRGRYSGFPGADVADRYIADHFGSLGLEKPFGRDGYYHRFAYGAGEYAMPSSLVLQKANGESVAAHFWRDLNVFKYSGFGKASGRVVFVGYGVSAPGLGWDDYAGMDVKGAIVLAWRGTPPLGDVDFGLWGLSGRKSTFALEQGAVGFIYCENDPPKWATISEDFYREDLPAVWVSKTFADTILASTGKTKEEWKRIADSTKTPVSQALDVRADLQISGKYYPRRKTCNIAGMLPGSDPVLRNEVIVIGAHMDHHGVDPAGNLYPGADDNASGTSVMMECARIFASMTDRPKRSLLFIGFAAEEEGLTGSKAFVKEPMLPRGLKIAAMLNMDMVGQGNCSLGVGGISEFPALGEAMFADWPDSALKALDFWGLYDGSDHASFRDGGIPSYVIGARGDHPNYHTPGDSAGNIKPEVMKAVGDMMIHSAAALADYPESILTFSGRGRWAIQRYGGVIHNVMETIPFTQSPARYEFPVLTGSPWPVENRVPGVEYPIPLVITRLMGCEGGGGPWGGTEYFRAIEALRSQAKELGIPFLADSVRSDFPDLAPYLGVAAALNADDLPYDTLELAALARAGVGFVLGSSSGSLDPWRVEATEASGPGWKEVAVMTRKAGMRLWLKECTLKEPRNSNQTEGKRAPDRGDDYWQDRGDEALKRLGEIAELVGNRAICEIRINPASDRSRSFPLVDSLLLRGNFLIVDDPEYVAAHRGKPEFARLGIPTQPDLCEALFHAGLSMAEIGNLLFANLQKTLQAFGENAGDKALGRSDRR